MRAQSPRAVFGLCVSSPISIFSLGALGQSHLVQRHLHSAASHLTMRCPLHWKITSPPMRRHLQISLPLHILALLVSSFQSIQERTGSDEFEALCGEKKLPMQCEVRPSIGHCLDVSCKTRTSTACTVARCPVFVTCEFLVLASGISFYVIRAFALGFVERSKCLTVGTSLALDTLSHETLPSPVPSLLRSTRNCRPALSAPVNVICKSCVAFASYHLQCALSSSNVFPMLHRICAMSLALSLLRSCPTEPAYSTSEQPRQSTPPLALVAERAKAGD